MKRLFVLLLTLGVFTGAAYAHNGMQHVMGTVTSITDTSITVKATDGKTQAVTVTSDTKYTKADATATLKDIKVGDHIVIHATKKGDQLTAAEVKVGAMKMKGMSGDMGGMKMDNKIWNHASQVKSHAWSVCTLDRLIVKGWNNEVGFEARVDLSGVQPQGARGEGGRDAIWVENQQGGGVRQRGTHERELTDNGGGMRRDRRS